MSRSIVETFAGALALAAALILFPPTTAASEQSPTHPSPNEQLSDRVDLWMIELGGTGQLSGTVLVARGDVVLFERSYGKADYELDVPNTPSTRFNIASVTKPLTQILALTLFDAESFDHPISRWLPEFPRGKEITLSHLLNHRAGIPHRVTRVEDEVQQQTAASVVKLAAGHDLLFEPGSDNEYSSGGYSVLARILEIEGGLDYDGLLRKHVARPAGAVHTIHPDGSSLIERRATPYFFGTEPIAAPLRDLSFLVGAGSVFSTPRDLFLIQRHLVKGGYGQRIRDQLVRENGLRWNGYTNGYRAFADYHAADELTVIFAGNMFTGAADLVRSTIPRIARGETVPAPEIPRHEPVAMSESARARIRGEYLLGESPQPLTFRSPMLASLGDWILVPISETSFFSPQDYAVVSVVTDEDGAVEGLQWGKGPLFPRADRGE